MEMGVERDGSSWPSKRLARRHMAALFAAGLVVLLATAVALAASGDITQPAGTAGCVSQGGVESCANGRALRNANGVAVSPDGESVYVAAQVGAVARLDRDTTTGAVTQPTGTSGCVREGSALCFKGHALSGASSVAVSPDGKNVYVASYFSDAVVRLNRNPTTGTVTEPAGTAGCISEDGSGSCADGHALDGAQGVAVSPDGKSVYVASVNSDAVVRLNRNPTTGALTEPAGAAGCISEDGSGPCADGHGLNGAWWVALTDGKNVYVASFLADAAVRLDRDTTTGAITEPAGTAGCVSEDGSGPCADGHGLSRPAGVALSADGKNIYVAAFGSGVARLSRNPTTGAITQPAGTAGCISETGAGTCADGHGLDGPSGVAVSGDGKSVYVAATSSPTNSAVARLNRNLTTGALTQPAGTPGCVSETGAGPCAHGHALKGATGVAVSPDGKSVYVASFNSNAAARFNRAP
jgi:DNA-binding beta-propeller fold protein YncE